MGTWETHTTPLKIAFYNYTWKVQAYTAQYRLENQREWQASYVDVRLEMSVNID